MKRAFDVLTAIAQQDPDVVLLTGDLGYKLFDDFQTECPGQFINAGIMEQNQLAVAAGMATVGKKPFVYSISVFPTLRALEMIKNEICYHSANVKIIAAGAGLNYGNLGYTHHAINDLSCIQSLPGITVYNPGDVFEARESIRAAYATDGPAYIRLGRTSAENGIVPTEGLLTFESPRLVFRGGNPHAAILSSGPCLYDAYCAARKLDITLFSFPVVNTAPAFLDALASFTKIVTVEESSIIGGFGSVIAQAFASRRDKPAILNIGIPNAPDFPVGSHEWLKEYFGISARAIEEKVSGFVNG